MRTEIVVLRAPYLVWAEMSLAPLYED